MLIERGFELALLRESLYAAREGKSSVVLLTGPLGIGRSALLYELASCVTDDVSVLQAHAAPMEQDFAFGVVRQLFDPLLVRMPDHARNQWLRDAGSAGPVLTDDLAVTGEDQDVPASDTVLHDLWSLVARTGAAAPVLILVDDLHWVDASSLRWLAYLAKRLHGLRAVLVCTLRDGDPRAQNLLVREVVEASTHVLRPGLLSLSATKEVISRQFGEAGDEEFAVACHETSAGNPVFLMSVLVGMAVGGHRPTAEQADTARSLRPSQLRERLAASLRTQPQLVRDLAAAIATLGEQGEPALAARLADLDTVGFTGALRVLHQLGLLAGEHRPRFVHRVVQDAVEYSFTAAERQRWRESAANLLYSSGYPAEQVAAQLMAVPVSGHTWSVSVLCAAADTALRRGAPDTAARYLRRALLDSPEQGEDRARLLLCLAAAERAFDASACERHIAQAIPLLHTARDRASAALRISPEFHAHLTPTAVDILRQAADDLGSPCQLTGSVREVALRLEARLRHTGRADSAEVTSAVERLRAHGDEPPADSSAERELLAVLLHTATLGAALPAVGIARQAHRILDREPATSARLSPVLPLVVMSLVGADSLRPLGSWLAAEEQARRGTGGIAEAVVHAQHALVSLARGHLAPARYAAERAFDLAEANWLEAGDFCTTTLAAVALEARDLALSDRILTHVGRHGHMHLMPSALLLLLQSAAQAQRGHWSEALETTLTCGRRLEAAGWHNTVLFPWRPWAISLLQRLGDERSALALAEEEHARATAWGAPVAVGRALRLKGRLLGSTGTETLREAVTVLRDSANQLELARALHALGCRPGEGDEAEAALREAETLAWICGAPWRAGPTAPGAADAGTAPGALLTRTERKVAGLAGGGRTNQEIARELGVSSRAVEKHLTNSYRKLGICGRSQLVSVLNGARAENRY